MITIWLEEQKEENVKELRIKNDGKESSTWINSIYEQRGQLGIFGWGHIKMFPH
jgi:hypothetical protein